MTGRGVLSLIEPAIVVAFGVILGLIDQSATDVSGLLRIPALIASLILVATGVIDFQTERHNLRAVPPVVIEEPSRVTVEQTPDGAVVEVEPAPVGRAVTRQAAVAQVIVTNGAAVREDQRVVYLVMGLAVWLGLATLGNPGAPWPLLVLSLIASFLLFAEAWQMLVRSRRPS